MFFVKIIKIMSTVVTERAKHQAQRDKREISGLLICSIARFFSVTHRREMKGRKEGHYTKA